MVTNVKGSISYIFKIALLRPFDSYALRSESDSLSGIGMVLNKGADNKGKPWP